MKALVIAMQTFWVGMLCIIIILVNIKARSLAIRSLKQRVILNLALSLLAINNKKIMC